MKLEVLERILVMSLLPQEATFLNLKLIRVAKEALAFTEEEHKKLNFRTGDDGLTHWDEVPCEADIEFGEVVTGIIVEELTKLNTEGKLKDEQFSIYEKFVSN